MMRQGLRAFLFLSTSFVVALAWAEPLNPFARPVTPQYTPVETRVANSVAQPELRGLIWAGPASIANLNGAALAIGESFAGYQLESVGEDNATFLRGDESITLYLPKREGLE
jgi:hypothetical protein